MHYSPIQYGRLGEIIAAASEMDATLAIFVAGSWVPQARAVVGSPRAHRGASREHAFYSEVFGDGPEAPTPQGELGFFLYVGQVQDEVKRRRKLGVSDERALCAAVIEYALQRNGADGPMRAAIAEAESPPARDSGPSLEAGSRAVRRPWWVQMTLLGIKRRQMLWTFVWMSLIAGIAFVAGGVAEGKPGTWLIGVFGLGAASMYYLTVIWISRHEGWRDDGVLKRFD